MTYSNIPPVPFDSEDHDPIEEEAVLTETEAAVDTKTTEDKPIVNQEEEPLEDTEAGPLGLEYGTTDGEVDKAKLTTPVSRAIDKIPLIGGINQFGDAAGQGLGDFTFDLLGAAGDKLNLPWLKRADQWWDDNNPASKDPFHTLIRDSSAVILPSIIANRLFIGGAAKLTAARHIPTAQRTIWSILGQMGIETSIAGITSQSYEQDNAAGALNKWLGWNIPWGTKDGMTPEARRHLHMYEAAGMSAAVDLTGAVFAFGNALRRVNLDQKALQQFDAQSNRLRQILKSDGSDPVTDVVEGTRGKRSVAQTEEAVKRYNTKTDGEYDPFINEPARPEQRVVPPEQVFDPDPVGAKGDLYAIQNNIDTIDGIARPVASKPILDTIMESTDGSTRGRILGDFYQKQLSAKADVIIDGNYVKSDALDQAVDKLVENLFDPNITFKHFQKIVKGGKAMTFRGRKFLNEDKWVEASYAWKKAHDMMFNPDNIKSSAMMIQQEGATISTTARSMNLLEGIGTNSRQWEIMSEKMKFLVSEVQTNKDIIARSRILRDLIAEGNYRRTAEWLNLQADSFDSSIAASKMKAYDVIDEINRIAKEYPEYMRPLAEAYDATNGDVNSLYKLHKFAENNIGLLKKGIYDRHPEMPSFFIRGLHAIRYNSVLNGLAPVRALTANTTIATIKPISVFAGAMASGDVGTFKRALYTYGGLIENFKRGFKIMGDDWRLANSNPEIAVKRGRHDIKGANMDNFQAMETMAEAWQRDGKDGKVAMWNMAKALTHWNNWKYNRWGVNGLYAIDGFFKSLMASGSARAKAYDALLEATNGSFSVDQFRNLQQTLYDSAFDSNGLLKDSAAKFASDELALTLDYKSIQHFESFLGHVPAAKALFMFPRTGLNALELTWSFNPASNIVPLSTRAKRALSAKTLEEIAEVMSEHGLENTPEALKALQSEYIGRQLMGSSIIMGAGIWALEGNLTGNGPQDAAERARMLRMGWKPKSFKNPFTGKWVSYAGLEPFESILGLVGDIIYQSDRVDQSITEDWFKKLLTAITMNIGNQTLTAGFEPLASLYTGDENAWNRFIASQSDMMGPQKGLRTILNNALSPALRDVDRDIKSQLLNLNKFLIPGNSKDLPEYLDVYTGSPIRFQEPITAAANALLPMFKQNGGMEPWRQWLLSTGWDGLTKPRQDEIAQEPLTPHARRYINNWIATHANLKGGVMQIMNLTDDQWSKELKIYKKSLGPRGLQKDYPIKKTLLYRMLDDLHTEAFTWALSAYHTHLQETDPNKVVRGYMRRVIKGKLKEGDTKGAGESLKELQQYK